MNSVEARSCGKCENFDRNDNTGEPVGTIKLNVGGELQEILLGRCRAPLGLAYGTRADISNCVHPEFKDKPNSIAEIQPEGVLV